MRGYSASWMTIEATKIEKPRYGGSGASPVPSPAEPVGDGDQPTRQRYDCPHNSIRLCLKSVNPPMKRAPPKPTPCKQKAPAVLVRGAKNKEGERSEKVGKPSPIRTLCNVRQTALFHEKEWRASFTLTVRLTRLGGRVGPARHATRFCSRQAWGPWPAMFWSQEPAWECLELEAASKSSHIVRYYSLATATI